MAQAPIIVLANLALVASVVLSPRTPLETSATSAVRAPWPFKGGNFNHSGVSSSSGPFNLSPAWIFEEPGRKYKAEGSPMKVFHSSPVIDEKRNSYIQSTTGWVYSINDEGHLNWEFDTGGANPGNLAYLDGSLYTMNQDGKAVAIDARTGKARWEKKVSFSAPDDTHTLTAVGDTLLTGCNVRDSHIEGLTGPTTMNADVCALSVVDGSLKWSANMKEMLGGEAAWGINHMHSIVDGSVLFSDGYGGVYRVRMDNGHKIWATPQGTDMMALYKSHGMLPYGTTATLVVGSNNVLYNVFNKYGGVGVLRAHDFETGKVLWEREFKDELNVAPAVGPVYPGGPLVVVLASGHNSDMMPASPEEMKLREQGKIPPWQAKVLAVDAATGEEVWTFTGHEFDGHTAGSSREGEDKGEGNLCAPDIWGTPSIGSDGVVYMNWSGGWSYALYDANRDGKVDIDDPKETSSYHHGHGSNGQTALAQGLAVAPTCRQLIAFKA